MKNLLLAILIFSSLGAIAQQQVIPEDFNGSQARLFRKVTEAVSTPCCQNGIPVAFHASGQAEMVRTEVEKAIRAGQDEDQIMAMLGEMRFGADGTGEIIFTVPDRNLLGGIYWILGGLLLVILLAGAYFLLRQGHSQAQELDNDDLVDKWQSHIRAEVEGS